MTVWTRCFFLPLILSSTRSSMRYVPFSIDFDGVVSDGGGWKQSYSWIYQGYCCRASGGQKIPVDRAVLSDSSRGVQYIIFISISFLVNIEYKESLINAMLYTTFTYSIPDLYMFPDENTPNLSFLALLMKLLLSYPHTTFRTQIITLLTKLYSLGSYPVHRLLPASVDLIYPMLMQLCRECLQEDGDGAGDEVNSVVQLMTTLGMWMIENDDSQWWWVFHG